MINANATGAIVVTIPISIQRINYIDNVTIKKYNFKKYLKD